MTNGIRIGLLGAGYILDSHAKALKAIPGVTLQAVCDVSRGRAEAAAKKYAVPDVFTSMAELAASDCDAIHILLPPALHLEAAHIMVAAGKSVFLEKPMGLSSTECAALCDAADARGVTIGVNHNFLFSPRYSALRSDIRAGRLGRLDHVSVNWHYALPFLQFGPFDNWMLAAPANTVFETGPHLCAFVVDLLGVPEVLASVAGNPIELPAGQRVFRHWEVVARAREAAIQLSISMTQGHPDRFLRVRARGGSAQLDFGRDIAWRDGTVTDNPLFDAYEVAKTAAAALADQATTDRTRRLKSALAKGPSSTPFDESIFESIRAFYDNGVKALDPRHDGRFATEVIRLCEAITTLAGVGAPSRSGVSIVNPLPAGQPTVLVVGGTGFIGRRLVRQLVSLGHSVRVMTRNPKAAALELGDLPVELFRGNHGDPASAREALQGIRTVYHLAKCDGKRWQDYLENDLEPTRVLAEASLEAGIERFIYTGTIASYDSASASSTINNLTGVDPSIASRNHYARSKAACEALLQRLQKERGLHLVIVRPGIVIGPGTPPAHLGVGRFSSETRVDFFGDGSTPLPLVLVDDVADALARCLSAPGIDGQTLLVTSPPLLTAREYVAEVGRYMGTEIDARPRSAWRYWLADLVKETAKNLVRHPNRRWPTLHDSKCSSHSARFDGQMTEQALQWHPVAERDTLIRRGVADAVEWFMR